MMEIDKSDTLKKKMLYSLNESRAIISTAALKAGISRQTHYRWIESDPDYANQVDEIKEAAIDSVESKLLDLIDEGNPTAIIFFLKTRARKRGYSEKIDLEAQEIKIVVEEKLMS